MADMGSGPRRIDLDETGTEPIHQASLGVHGRRHLKLPMEALRTSRRTSRNAPQSLVMNFLHARVITASL